jgi:hypothetical protein
MKTTSVRAILAVSLGLTLAPACLASGPPADPSPGVRDSARSLGHAVAEDSRRFGHEVAEKSTQAGHAIADAARRLGLDIKSGAHEVKAAVTHDGTGHKD